MNCTKITNNWTVSRPLFLCSKSLPKGENNDHPTMSHICPSFSQTCCCNGLFCFCWVLCRGCVCRKIWENTSLHIWEFSICDLKCTDQGANKSFLGTTLFFMKAQKMCIFLTWRWNCIINISGQFCKEEKTRRKWQASLWCTLILIWPSQATKNWAFFYLCIFTSIDFHFTET